MKKIGLFAAFFLILVFFQTSVDAQNGADSKIQTWKNTIAEWNPLFSQWKDANVKQLFTESEKNGQGASLWHVEKDSRNLGYFVTANQGQTLLEVSPITSLEMLAVDNQVNYRYAGPGMHLYQSTTSPKDNWRNLGNGETIAGRPTFAQIPDEPKQSITSEQIKQYGLKSALAYPTSTDSDRGIAVMIQHSLGHSIPFDKNSLPPGKNPAGYLVYSVLEKDYYSVWAITGEILLTNGQTFLQVQDVFSNDGYPIYIRSDVSVNWVGSR